MERLAAPFVFDDPQDFRVKEDLDPEAVRSFLFVLSRTSDSLFSLLSVLREILSVEVQALLLKGAVEEGMRVHVYLDDWLVLAGSQDMCSLHTRSVLEQAAALGFRINLQKSDLVPAQQFKFLASGEWPPDQKTLHINLLELEAVRLSLKAFQTTLTVPLPLIMDAAYWRSENTFLNFYLRDSARLRQDGSWGVGSLVASQRVLSSSSQQ
nr:hypothetical protein BaRGS_023419 [Batillaria attramentaria]